MDPEPFETEPLENRGAAAVTTYRPKWDFRSVAPACRFDLRGETVFEGCCSINVATKSLNKERTTAGTDIVAFRRRKIKSKERLYPKNPAELPKIRSALSIAGSKSFESARRRETTTA